MYGTTLDGERVVVHTPEEWADIEARLARLRELEATASVVLSLLSPSAGAVEHGPLVGP